MPRHNHESIFNQLLISFFIRSGISQLHPSSLNPESVELHEWVDPSESLYEDLNAIMRFNGILLDPMYPFARKHTAIENLQEIARKYDLDSSFTRAELVMPSDDMRFSDRLRAAFRKVESKEQGLDLTDWFPLIRPRSNASKRNKKLKLLAKMQKSLRRSRDENSTGRLNTFQYLRIFASHQRFLNHRLTYTTNPVRFDTSSQLCAQVLLDAYSQLDMAYQCQLTGISFLHIAFGHGTQCLVQQIIDERSAEHISVLDYSRWTPIHYALTHNQDPSSVLEVARKSSVFDDFDWDSALHWAAYTRNVGAAHILLKLNVNPDSEVSISDTRLSWTIRERQTVRTFNTFSKQSNYNPFKRYSDSYERMVPPLYISCRESIGRNKTPRLIRLLIEYGADPLFVLDDAAIIEFPILAPDRRMLIEAYLARIIRTLVESSLAEGNDVVPTIAQYISFADVRHVLYRVNDQLDIDPDAFAVLEDAIMRHYPDQTAVDSVRPSTIECVHCSKALAAFTWVFFTVLSLAFTYFIRYQRTKSTNAKAQAELPAEIEAQRHRTGYLKFDEILTTLTSDSVEAGPSGSVSDDPSISDDEQPFLGT